MVELTLQGILSTPFEPKGSTGGKSVYHVSEHVFRMSPVYTRFALAPGFHIPRLWRSLLLVPQRHEWIDFRRAQCWNKTRNESDRYQQCRYDNKRDRISFLNLEQQRRHHTRQRKRS